MCEFQPNESPCIYVEDSRAVLKKGDFLYFCMAPFTTALHAFSHTVHLYCVGLGGSYCAVPSSDKAQPLKME